LRIVCNKIDLKENRKFEYSEAKEFEDKNNFRYRKTNEKTYA
jgi:hypothetical protein